MGFLGKGGDFSEGLGESFCVLYGLSVSDNGSVGCVFQHANELQ